MAKVLPISFEGWDDIDTLAFNHYNAEFTEDFGVFKKGQKFDSLMVDFEKGIMEAYDQDGEVLAKQEFKLAPIQ